MKTEKEVKARLNLVNQNLSETLALSKKYDFIDDRERILAFKSMVKILEWVLSATKNKA